ncbi:hypothetical protein [Terasakiella sp.]|uniref:hypothetical protein n=1 Tax=Terasakiella sp. TaxID=2034861 RepID=UPI003AA91B2C
MPNIAIGLFLFAVSIFSLHGSAAAETSKNIESAIRHAWETNDCKRAASLMDEMRTTSSQAVYSFYQAEAFEFGRCSERNIDKAITAYKNAYNISQSLGAMHIGALYLNEKNDPETAQKWFRMMAVLFGSEKRSTVEPEDRYRISEAVKDLFVQALFGNREFPEKEFEEALKWAYQLKNSDAKQIYEQALVFEKGLNGYPISKNAFNKLLHLAVRQDYPQAAWRFAQRLLDEVKTGKRALSAPMGSLTTAAHGGIVKAQVQLARTFRDINKNTRDLERAYEWFIFARKNGADVDTEIKHLTRRIDPTKAAKIRKNIEQNNEIPR